MTSCDARDMNERNRTFNGRAHAVSDFLVS